MEGCTITESTSPGVWVVQPSGDLDAYSASLLLKHTSAGLSEHPPKVFLIVLVDLSAVGFIDSVGLGVCTAILRRAHTAGHRVALIAPHEAVRRLLARTGIARVYPVYRTLDQALHATKPSIEPFIAARTGPTTTPVTFPGG